jgi:hypothetical protein
MPPELLVLHLLLFAELPDLNQVGNHATQA